MKLKFDKLAKSFGERFWPHSPQFPGYFSRGDESRSDLTPFSQISDDDKPWTLVPLTPEYLELEHRGYVKAINEALNIHNIRNIALSGNFGVGKSSILQKVAELRKGCVVELSLSTLAPLGGANLDESVPKQATTTTNRIQQEIVKQLLYREEPNKTPGSRFRRIERFGWFRELIIASLVGFVVAVIFLLTGWTGRIATELKPLFDLGLWAHPIVLVLAGSVTVISGRLFHGRIHLLQLTAGPASVTLDDKSASYFDQYLDEIVYFFEVSKRNIVIFEDIDRFNDSHIFETLRALNTLLNASPQIGKPIRFIYAIKDSIFDRIGLELEGREFEPTLSAIEDPAQAEAVRANRTKFFDLVIPVVPFITHRSARNLTIKLLNKIDHQVDTDLIDLAAKHVPDMRMLKNVHNEFIVFRDRIFSGDGKQLKLSETDLFAMMLYKSTHLTDFEAIRIGKSKLDQLYELGRSLIVTNVRRIEREVRTIRRNLANLDNVTSQSSRLGDQLIAHVERTARAAQILMQNSEYFFVEVKSKDELRSPKFWREFVQKTGDPVLKLNNRYYGGNSLSFTRSDLAEALNANFDPESWDESLREELNATLEKCLEDLAFLRSADMGNLIQRPEFLIKYNDSDQSFGAVTRHLLSEGLAYQLIRAGYINRNFTLYTSTFHGDRVSSAATNFIIHHVERNIMDEYFQLDSDDVEAVIRECGKKVLTEPALYNIAILDHFLSTDVDTANIMIESLLSFGDDQKRFMQAYLNSAREPFLFVKHFVEISSRALVYFVNQVELSEPNRLKIVSDALRNLVDQNEYRADAAVATYLKDNYAELPALTLESLNEPGAKRIGKVFSEAGIRVPELEPLSGIVRQAFVEQDLYVINRENLAIALGSDTEMALDNALSANEGVYSYILGNLDAYLSAIDGFSATIGSEESFITVVEDVLVSDADRLDEVIAHASENCIVNDLEDVSEGAWPYLARHKRFPVTFSNVSHYIKSIGSIDEDLAKALISDEEITEHEAAEKEDKERLAKIILAAHENLPSASLRTKLVASLKLGDYLDVDEIPAENGELFALLLKQNIVEDKAATYDYLSKTDWPTRECFVHESKKFKEYMNPALVRGDLAALLQSDKVDLAIKSEIADRASEYVEGSGREDLAQLARFATQYKRQLALDVVEKLASNGVPTHYVVRLLVPHLETVLSDQLFRILQSLDGDYPNLTSVGSDKPKIPNTTEDRMLLEKLKRHHIISTYSAGASSIKVYKRRK